MGRRSSGTLRQCTAIRAVVLLAVTTLLLPSAPVIEGFNLYYPSVTRHRPRSELQHVKDLGHKLRNFKVLLASNDLNLKLATFSTTPSSASLPPEPPKSIRWLILRGDSHTKLVGWQKMGHGSSRQHVPFHDLLPRLA